MKDVSVPDQHALLCSECFTDEGLKLDALKIGSTDDSNCANCGSPTGRKLTEVQIRQLAWRFFVGGTTFRTKYGAAPVLQINEHHYGRSTIVPSPWLTDDTKLIEDAAKIGVFHYGPRLWMVGEVEPLKDLQDAAKRAAVIDRIIREYPEHVLSEGSLFYRLRVKPSKPADPKEFDSPPIHLAGNGRLDSPGFPVMYGSQDLDVCIHECHVAVDDEIYVATLHPQRDLRLLDLTALLQETVTEFESLDMAVHMLFLAGSHSYEICREISLAAKAAGFDGVAYPSFFSLIRTGGHPFETTYGLSVRRFHPQAEDYAKAFTIRNFALFGRPLEELTVSVKCINRLVLTQVGYQGYFGPVSY